MEKVYLISQVLKNGTIGQIHIGMDQEDIKCEIDEFILNPIRTSRKSKLFTDNYENIMFTFENKKIVSIQINFENKNVKSIVCDDLFEELTCIDDWINFAKQNNWEHEKFLDTYSFRKNNTHLSVNHEGKLHLISIY